MYGVGWNEILLGGVKVKITVRFKDKGNRTALDVLEYTYSQQSTLSRWEE